MESPLSRFDWERLIRELSLPASVKCTAYALATYVDGKTGVNGHPGLANLSRATELSESTVSAALAALEAGGLVFRKQHGGGRGVKRAAVYDLTVGATGLTEAGETERTIRTVFKDKTKRKTSYSTNSNGVKSSYPALKTSEFRTKDFVQSAPIMHRSRLTTSSADDPGITVGVEGNDTGLEAHRQAELARLEAWSDEQYQADLTRLRTRARKQEQAVEAWLLQRAQKPGQWTDDELVGLMAELGVNSN